MPNSLSGNTRQIAYYYATVSAAIAELEADGYSTNLNLKDNCIVGQPEQWEGDSFQIMKIYRYEGDSDPADEAAVYAVQSTSGMKGILVTGYGASIDNNAAAILNVLVNPQ